MRDQAQCFVDEFGDTNINTDLSGVSQSFIMTAILVEATALAELRQSVEQIRRRHFQTGEMKSSKIAGNDSRRIKILRELAVLNYKFYAIVVDKTRIFKGSGLRYKRTFFKYQYNMLYQTLNRAFSSISVVADEHGSREYMDGFRVYLNRNLQLELPLLMGWDFQFESSRDELMLQVADLLSGTLARCYDSEKKSDCAAEMLEIIASKSVGIETWPPLPTPQLGETLEDTADGRLDEMVRKQCDRLAAVFLRAADRNNEKQRPIIEVLEFLMFHSRYVSDTEYVVTDHIREYLSTYFDKEISEQFVRSSIAQLRDSNVIIASGPLGYKLPTQVRDIMQYVKHADTIVPPMVARLSRARQELRIASMGELDILSRPEFRTLRMMVEAVSKQDEASSQSV